MVRKKKVKKKLEVVFDPEKRKEFLTGFQKRKNERRKRAKEQLERNIKDERKKIRQEIKEGFKHLKKTHEPLRELTEDDKKEDIYEDEDVEVKIVELSTSDLAASNHMLGQNKAVDSEDSDHDSEDTGTDEYEVNDVNRIPGMDFDVNIKRKRDIDGKRIDSSGKTSTQGKPFVDVKSKKELDRLKKNKTLKKLKQSKVFKAKERFEKQVNKKKVQRDRNKMLRSLTKVQRKNLKIEPCKYSKGRMLNRKQLRKKKQQCQS